MLVPLPSLFYYLSSCSLYILLAKLNTIRSSFLTVQLVAKYVIIKGWFCEVGYLFEKLSTFPEFTFSPFIFNSLLLYLILIEVISITSNLQNSNLSYFGFPFIWLSLVLFNPSCLFCWLFYYFWLFVINYLLQLIYWSRGKNKFTWGLQIKSSQTITKYVFILK